MSELFELVELDHVVGKFREKRLRERLVGERRITEIKRLLEEIVKDPRRRVK
jgi:hypothetical protein